MIKLTFIFSLLLSLPLAAQVIRANDNLFNLTQTANQGKTPQMVINESLLNYDRFIQLDVNSYLYTPLSIVNQDANKARTVSVAQANHVIQSTISNPVVASHQNQKYDPDRKGIGFCFGRAMFTHLYLAQAGVNRANIKKAFVVGPMMNGAWAWHVATVVQSTLSSGQETWLVLDPVIGYVVDVRTWYKRWLQSSDDKKLRLFIADSGKFGAHPGNYDERNKTDAFYNRYFSDMDKWFEENYQSVRLP